MRRHRPAPRRSPRRQNMRQARTRRAPHAAGHGMKPPCPSRPAALPTKGKNGRLRRFLFSPRFSFDSNKADSGRHKLAHRGRAAPRRYTAPCRHIATICPRPSLRAGMAKSRFCPPLFSLPSAFDSARPHQRQPTCAPARQAPPTSAHTQATARMQGAWLGDEDKNGRLRRPLFSPRFSFDSSTPAQRQPHAHRPEGPHPPAPAIPRRLRMRSMPGAACPSPGRSLVDEGQKWPSSHIPAQPALFFL